jgi:hypothetical protein
MLSLDAALLVNIAHVPKLNKSSDGLAAGITCRRIAVGNVTVLRSPSRRTPVPIGNCVQCDGVLARAAHMETETKEAAN